MKVVQCWDDGVTSDAQLTDLFRRHGAQASFNLNAGLHGRVRTPASNVREIDVLRLSVAELKTVYRGFTIANHTLIHRRMDTLAAHDMWQDISENRRRLQDLFDQPIDGFAYPYGVHSPAIAEVVKDAGHTYARTTNRSLPTFPPTSRYSFHPTCHFLAKDFWPRYEASKAHGVFYFWGHSYELRSPRMWAHFECMIEQISDDDESEWAEIADLFTRQPACKARAGGE